MKPTCNQSRLHQHYHRNLHFTFQTTTTTTTTTRRKKRKERERECTPPFLPVDRLPGRHDPPHSFPKPPRATAPSSTLDPAHPDGLYSFTASPQPSLQLGVDSTYVMKEITGTMEEEDVSTLTSKELYFKAFKTHVLHEGLQRLMTESGFKPLIRDKEVRRVYEDMTIIFPTVTMKLPAAVVNLMGFEEIRSIMYRIYPTNNRFAGIGGLRKYGDVMAKFLDENQGCCYWFVVMDTRGMDPNPPVFVGQVMEGDEEGGEEGEDGEGIEVVEVVKGGERVVLSFGGEGVGECELSAKRWSDFWREYVREGIEWHRGEGFGFKEGEGDGGDDDDDDDGVDGDDGDEGDDDLEESVEGESD
ncbi:hypothetical protein BC829DRAFT_398481 [Chytridium lagenaria]|nr:hypothetical protein BC829DRAFT_398481 [Chytridium lagenaria]